MHPLVLLIATACNTGTAWQQYACAHPDMNTPAGRAGFETGQAMGPVVLVLLALLVVYLVARAVGRSRRTATGS